MKNLENLKKEINNVKARGCWSKGVKTYALEIVEDLEQFPTSEKQLLNGAQNWKEYSWGGCSLIYNCDICERLCMPHEKKSKKNGLLKPNTREDWLDVQARALRQASWLILDIASKL